MTLEHLQEIGTTYMPDWLSTLAPEWVLVGACALLGFLAYVLFKSTTGLLRIGFASILPFIAATAAWLAMDTYGAAYLSDVEWLPLARVYAAGGTFFLVAMCISWPLLAMGWLKTIGLLGLTLLIAVICAYFGEKALQKNFKEKGEEKSETLLLDEAPQEETEPSLNDT